MRLACTCLLLCLAAPASAQESAVSAREQVQTLDRQARDSRARQDALATQAQALDRQLEITTSQMVALARAIQSHERRLTALETSLSRLDTLQQRALADLGSRQDELANLLAAFQRLSRRPPALVLARPRSALETARTAGMMQVMVAELRARAQDLRDQTGELRRVRSQQIAERARYARELADLERSRRSIARLRLDRERSRSQVVQASAQTAERLAELAQESTNLRDLLQKLDAANTRSEQLASLPGHRFRPADLVREQASPQSDKAAAEKPTDDKSTDDRAAPETTPSQAVASAPDPRQAPNFAMPASGRIVTAFGANTEAGVSSRGVTIQTRSGAQVTAAASGRVLFAGEFRGYGLLVIVAHSNGYHSLLAGFARIDVAVGEPVRVGEPVGVMPGDSAPELYLEVRRDGQPINPAAWLRRSSSKAANAQSG